MNKITIKNPIVADRCADPEARFYEGKYWIYVTSGWVTAYSSADLVNWEKHPDIADKTTFPWATKLIWAPTIIDKNGKYYLIFASNDIQSNDECGGLEIGVSDSPAGPFKSYLGGPLIDRFIKGAQPIDAHFFKDDDGTVYLYYGGWGHCNVAMMNDDMTGFKIFDDGEVFKEITPEHYIEAPCMVKKDGWYYFMWSTGNYGDDSYAVLYASSKSPAGPFAPARFVLKSQPPVADGPGHHGYLYHEPSGEWLCVYHRHFVGESARYICIDRMNPHDGVIDDIIMTNEWELEIK